MKRGDPVAEVNATNNYSYANNTTANSQTSGTGMDGLGTDTFLQLLITQMRYQDPFSGQQDMSQFMNQVAQFTMLERLIKLQQSMDAFTEQQGYTQALNLLNRNVEINDDGFFFEGEVTAVSFIGGVPMIKIDGKEYPLNMITKVE